MKHQCLFPIACITTLLAGVAHAEWRPVAEGIEYRSFELDGPLKVFVARADRENQAWTIDTSLGGGSLKSGTDTVSQLAERYDDSVNFKGERYDVKVAINGDYFNVRNGRPLSGQIISGWFVDRYLEYSGGTGFVWTTDRTCFLGGNVRNGRKQQHVVFPDKSELRLDGLNTAREADQLVLYTPHFASTTGTGEDGVEVLVQIDEPVGVASSGGVVKGRIADVRKGRGASLLYFDQIVLSGHGKAARALEAHAAKTEAVAIHLGITDYGVEEVQVPVADWNHAYAGIGGHFYCVTNGRVPAERWERKGKPGAINRHPRTSVAFNDRYVYFVVADGRSERSVGMTITELGRFCLDHLQADDAIAQDGGGSSTLWLDGKVMNVPSDGQERAVANGYFMAIVHEPSRSTAWSAGRDAELKGNVPLKLGPGNNLGSAGALKAGDTVRILPHRFDGIHAKHAHWWFCGRGDRVGWIPEHEFVAPAEKTP